MSEIWLPDAHWGTADTPLPAPLPDPSDRDDDAPLPSVPPDVLAMLGMTRAEYAAMWVEDAPPAGADADQPRDDDGKFGHGTHTLLYAQGGRGGKQKEYILKAGSAKEAQAAARKQLPSGGGYALKTHKEVTHEGKTVYHK